MSDRIRPLVFGYICEGALDGGEPLTSAETRLEHFARSEGFTLGTIFIDRRHAVPSAFDALMQQFRRGDEAWGIVIPDIGHLNDANRPGDERQPGGLHEPDRPRRQRVLALPLNRRTWRLSPPIAARSAFPRVAAWCGGRSRLAGQ